MGTEVIVDRSRTQLTTAPSLARRVSWGAIFAGLFVTIVIQLLFTLLGLATGLVTVNPASDPNAARHIALGAGIWLLVTGLISIWVGSCIAGRLCGGPLRSDGLIHGLVTWSVSTCATMFLLATTAGALLGGTGALWSGTIAVGGAAAGQDSAMTSIQDSLPALFPQPAPKLTPTGRTDNSPSAQQNDTKSDQQNTGTAPDKGTRTVAQGALWGCIALVLGLLAAAAGGWTGAASLPAIDLDPAKA